MERDGEIEILYCGNGFLQNMVRILTGTLIEVGRGERAPESMPALLKAKERKQAGYTAPPQGLRLEKVTYETMAVSYTHLSITKYGVTVRRREDLGKIIKMAFYIAQTGKPGPVLIDIPKDIQTASGSAEYPSHVDIRGYKPIHGVHIGQLKKAYKMLKSAKKPLILAGGGVNISHAGEKLKRCV